MPCVPPDIPAASASLRTICRAEMLREGTLDLTITQDLFRQGSLPLTLLCDLLQLGAQPDKDQLSTSISIICSQNID